MNIHTVYTNRYEIPAESHSRFTAKAHPSSLELLGLESILVAFVQQYEEESAGEVYSKNFTDFTRYNETNVDILDGCFDTYIFEDFAIVCIYATDNGIPVLSCRKLAHPDYDDPFDIVRNIDWYSECERVLFRLD